MKNNLRSQAGMTLIELTVVLLVLIGLAGLALPYVSGFMSQTHQATTLSSLVTLNDVVANYTNKAFGTNLPNKLDSLTVNTNPIAATSFKVGDVTVTLPATAVGDIYPYLQNTEMLSGAAPSAAEVASLAGAGVTTVMGMDGFAGGSAAGVGFDATFKGGNLLVPIAPTAKLAKLTGCASNSCANGAGPTFYGSIPVDSGDAVQNQLLYAFGGSVGSAADITAKACQTTANGGTCQGTWDTVCTNYYVFGVNSANSLVPKNMSQAPVHFSGTGVGAPNYAYDYFNLVYAVPNGATGCTNTGAPATFAGASMIMGFPAIVGMHGSQQFTAENYTK